MDELTSRWHKKSWKSGHAVGYRKGRNAKNSKLESQIWDMGQSRIDSDAWLLVKGVIIGILIMLVANYLGAIYG